jgi:drug/metabolite transporter (DMT)-like permease
MMLSSFASFLLSAVISLAMDGVPVLGGWEWFGLAMNGIFSYALATTFWAMALDRGKTASISNLAYVTPFLSLIWTSLFLKEKVSLWSLAGLLILVGGIFIQLKEPKK